MVLLLCVVLWVMLLVVVVTGDVVHGDVAVVAVDGVVVECGGGVGVVCDVASVDDGVGVVVVGVVDVVVVWCWCCWCCWR